MLRRLVVVLATIAAAVALAPVAGATANTDSTDAAAMLAPEVAEQVEPAISTCEDTYLCFWVDGDYRGERGRVAGNNTWWGNFPESTCRLGHWSDCASSAKNRGLSCTAWVHTGVNYGGTHHAIERGGNRRYLTHNGINDAISSNSWC